MQNEESRQLDCELKPQEEGPMCLANGSMVGDGYVLVDDVEDDEAAGAITPDSRSLTPDDTSGARRNTFVDCCTEECGGLGYASRAGVAEPRGQRVS